MSSRIFDCFSTTNSPELCTSWGVTRARICVHDCFLSRGQSWTPPPTTQFGTSEGRRRQAEAPGLKHERLSDTDMGGESTLLVWGGGGAVK